MWLDYVQLVICKSEVEKICLKIERKLNAYQLVLEKKQQVLKKKIAFETKKYCLYK